MMLLGKVTVVTGAAAGLGRAIAARFAQEGAAVVAADIDESEGIEFVQALQGQGHDAFFLRTDVSDEHAVQQLLDAAASRYGHIDVLCNNAAVLLYDHDSVAHELSLDAWDRIMGV